ncbi:MAG: stage V sporulation protein D, partial [Candidatus Omnitrophica bacterium]|nr:stage V sporulation protein D [Candidatus Omnitrophota bacterium]
PIGQGIAVTPLQLACAVSVIANGGYLVKPYVVEQITTWEGMVYKQFNPVIKRQVLSEETCDKMKDILNKVVVEGTGRRARSKLYEACGKTGTAQMVNPKGGYYENKYDATFIGFVSKEDPIMSIVVIANDPHPVHFGGSVAAPTFKRIVERTLQYLESNKVTVGKKE